MAKVFSFFHHGAFCIKRIRIKRTCYEVFRTSTRQTSGKPKMIKLSTNCKAISIFAWQPWKRETFEKKDRETEGSNQMFRWELFYVYESWIHHLDAHVHTYLCVKLPWVDHSTIAGGKIRIAAAVRKIASSCIVKPGSFQPVPVVMDTTTLQLTGIKRQNTVNVRVIVGRILI